jgi:hypothetical protein
LTIFDKEGVDRFLSGDVDRKLIELEHRPWLHRTKRRLTTLLEQSSGG